MNTDRNKRELEKGRADAVDASISLNFAAIAGDLKIKLTIVFEALEEVSEENSFPVHPMRANTLSKVYELEDAERTPGEHNLRIKLFTSFRFSS